MKRAFQSRAQGPARLHRAEAGGTARKRNIPYGHQQITEADIAAVVETLKSDYLTQGPKIGEFEKKFAAYVDAPHALAVDNATSGLHLAAKALGVKEGVKVIVTPITFASSANCVKFCGGDVVFCDIDPDTYLMDIKKLEKMLASAPQGTYSGIIPVDFGGYPHKMDEFRELADRYGLWILEDACHAPGAAFQAKDGSWQKTGNSRYADATVFSFHPVKHITTGEGGMVTTRNEALYKKMALYRTHGITKDPDLLQKNDGGWYYEMVDLGYNYRITDFQAALGMSQLDRAEAGIARRQEIARRYDEAFAGAASIRIPFVGQGIRHAYHLYVIQVPDRLGLYDHLRSKGIYAQVHYIPLHLQPYYRQLGSKEGDCPVAEDYYAHCLSLPMFPTLTEEEQDFVIGSVLEFYGK